MAASRVIALNLVAFDMAFAERLMSEGGLRELADLRARSVDVPLQHGAGFNGRDTGRSNEHVSTGLRPETTGIWSNFEFRADDYSVVKRLCDKAPFLSRLSASSVVFDLDYFDFSQAPDVRGLTGWGGHEESALPGAHPENLRQEVQARFGPPCLSHQELNETAYGDADRCRVFAERLVMAVEQRFAILEWMLEERFPDWDLALASVQESHDAIEHLQHGIEPEHPHRNLVCAAAARDGMQRIYAAISAGIGRLVEAFPDARFAVFSMHGMGPNKNDVPSMVLLPELMYRAAFKEPLLYTRPDWESQTYPRLEQHESWTPTILRQLRPSSKQRLSRLPRRITGKLRRLAGAAPEPISGPTRTETERAIYWVPAAHYRPYWPRMEAFALPSLNNGQVRINLEGREARGRIPQSEYAATLDRLEHFLLQSRDTATGKPAIERIERVSPEDPMAVNGSMADLNIYWAPYLYGIDHPDVGRIGPVPVRRMGGHTGGPGVLLVSGNGIEPARFDTRDSYDVVPTVIDLYGAQRPDRLDGESVLSNRVAVKETVGA